MSVALTSTLPTVDTSAPVVPGTDLARWIAAGISQHGAARKLDANERDALAQDVALAVLAAGRNLPPCTCTCGAPARWRWTITDDHGASVYVHRCDAHRWQAHTAHTRPILRPPSVRTVLDGRAAHERRAYIRRAISSAMQRATWQEDSSRYMRASERQRDTDAMVTPAGADVDRSDTGAPVGVLAKALDAASAKLDTAPNVGTVRADDTVRADLRATADTLAQEHGWTRAQARYVHAALARCAAVALSDDPVACLQALADERDTTLHATQESANRGGKLLRAIGPRGAVHAAVLQAMRDTLAHDRNWLDHWRHMAGETVAVLARDGGNWDSASLHTARGLPERRPNVARMAGPPVNVRRRTVPTARRVAPELARVESLAPLPAVREVERRLPAVLVSTPRTPGACTCERGACPVHVAPMHVHRMAHDPSAVRTWLDTLALDTRQHSELPTGPLAPRVAPRAGTVAPFRAGMTVEMLRRLPVAVAWTAARAMRRASTGQRRPAPLARNPARPCGCESCVARREADAKLAVVNGGA